MITNENIIGLTWGVSHCKAGGGCWEELSLRPAIKEFQYCGGDKISAQTLRGHTHSQMNVYVLWGGKNLCLRHSLETQS